MSWRDFFHRNAWQRLILLIRSTSKSSAQTHLYLNRNIARGKAAMQARRVTDSVLLLEIEGTGKWTQDILWSIGYKIYMWKHKSAAGSHPKKSVTLIKMFMPGMPPGMLRPDLSQSPIPPGMPPPGMPLPGMPPPGMPPPGGMLVPPGMQGSPIMPQLGMPQFDLDGSIYMRNAALQMENANLFNEKKKLEDAKTKRIQLAESKLTSECRQIFRNIGDKDELAKEKQELLANAVSQKARDNIRKCYVEALSRINKLSQRRRRTTFKRRRRNRSSTKKEKDNQKIKKKRFQEALRREPAFDTLTYTINEFRQMLSERNPNLCNELDFIMSMNTKGKTRVPQFSYGAPIFCLIELINSLYEGTTEDMELVFRCCSNKIMPFWAEGALAFLVDSDYLNCGDYLKMCVQRWKFLNKKNRIFVSQCLYERVKTFITKAVPEALIVKPAYSCSDIQSVHELPKSLHLVLQNQRATTYDIKLKHRGIEKFWDCFSSRGACLFSPTYIFKQWKYARLLRKLRPHAK